MICTRQHPFYNQKYHIFIGDSYFSIGKSINNIKYRFKLNTNTILKWKVKTDHNMNGFEINIKNTVKWFKMSHSQTLNLMNELSGRILYQNLSAQYKLITQIGSGSFSKVFKVLNIRSGKFEACKVILGSTFQDFENEIQILSQLHHQNIQKLNGIYLESGRLCILSDYAKGGSLRNYLQKLDSIKIQNVYIIMKQILSALEYLHNKGIVHRDIKPENILLKKKNSLDQLYLIDFGLATKLEEVSVRYPSCGTPGYIAPEIINFDPIKTYDEVSDVFSCGALLYKLIYGKDLFPGSQYTIIMAQNKEFQSTDKQFDKTQYSDLLHGMLNENPEQRLTATQALLKLEQIQFQKLNFNLDEFEVNDYEIPTIQKVKYRIINKLKKNQ